MKKVIHLLTIVFAGRRPLMCYLPLVIWVIFMETSVFQLSQRDSFFFKWLSCNIFHDFECQLLLPLCSSSSADMTEDQSWPSSQVGFASSELCHFLERTRKRQKCISSESNKPWFILSFFPQQPLLSRFISPGVQNTFPVTFFIFSH